MDKQPEDLVLKQLLEMSLKNIVSSCKANKRLNKICFDNQDYIFMKLLKRDFNLDFNKIRSRIPDMLDKMSNKFHDLDLSKPIGVYRMVRHLAMKNGHYLLYMLDLLVTDLDGENPLFYAIKQETPREVRLLIDAGVPVDKITKKGKSIWDCLQDKMEELEDKVDELEDKVDELEDGENDLETALIEQDQWDDLYNYLVEKFYKTTTSSNEESSST